MPLFLAILLSIPPVQTAPEPQLPPAAERAPSTAAAAADKFSLDLPADPATEPPPIQPAATGAGQPSADPAAPVATAPPDVPAPVPSLVPAPAAAAPEAAGSTPEPPPTVAAGSADFSLDTPIETLLADVRARAVLDRNLPGLSDDANLAKFKALSLRRLAPLSGGQLTEELLARTAYDLAALSAGAPPPAAAPARKRIAR